MRMRFRAIDWSRQKPSISWSLASVMRELEINTSSTSCRRQNLPKQTKGHATAGQKHEHQNAVNNKYRPRETFEAKRKKNCQHAQHRTKHYCLGKDDQVVETRIAPDAAVHAHHQKRSHLDENQHRQRSQEKCPGRAA